MIDNLPKRTDTIYKEIESFEDYEYTNCIAYEMMIRDVSYINKVKTTINEIYSLNLKLNYYTDIYNKKMSGSIILNDKDVEEVIQCINDVQNDIKGKYLNISIDNDDFEQLKFLVNIPFFTQNQKYFLEEVIDNLIREVNGKRGYCNPIDIYEEDYTLEEYNQSMEDYLDNEYTSEFEIIRMNVSDEIYNGFKVNSTTWLPPLKNAYYGNNEHLNEITSPPFLVLTGQYKHYKEIKPYFKRDIIQIKNEREVSLNINLALPLEELKSYIENIKKEYDKDNSIIKNPIELIGEELEKAEKIKSKAVPKDKNKRKKAMADAFYIYDVWKILESHYAQRTIELKAEQEKEIKAIKQNINYDKHDKKSAILEIKEKYNDLLMQYTKPYLKTEIATQLNISTDTIDKLHSLMIKYIDNLKYKELITGITN